MNLLRLVSEHQKGGVGGGEGDQEHKHFSRSAPVVNMPLRKKIDKGTFKIQSYSSTIFLNN